MTHAPRRLRHARRDPPASERGAARATLSAAVTTLLPREQLLLSLHYVEDLTPAEMGAVLELSVEDVLLQLAQALHQLCRVLAITAAVGARAC